MGLYNVKLYDIKLWGSLDILSGLGPDDPGSNPGSPILKGVNFIKGYLFQ